MEVEKIVETDAFHRASQLVTTVLEADGSAVGQIVGAPGTGKTELSRWLHGRFGGVRIVAWPSITPKALLGEVYERLTGRTLAKASEGRLMGEIRRHVQPAQEGRHLLIIDECNHLDWPCVESLRYLADELGFGLLLVGTDLVKRDYRGRNADVLYAQLSSRIGGKRLEMKPMPATRLAVHVLLPRFGEAGKQEAIAKEFTRACGGFWRNARELAATCERVMKVKKVEALTVEIIQAASALMLSREGT